MVVKLGLSEDIDVERLKHTEMNIVRWMYIASVNDSLTNVKLRTRHGSEYIYQ